VEGQGSKNFSKAKNFIYNFPGTAHRLLGMIADTTAAYLSAKIEAGADAVQIFDTWGGILSPDDFETFSLQYIERVVSQIKRAGEPVVVFAKGVHSRLNRLARCGADVLGLDWTIDIGEVRQTVGRRVALQGNLDPAVLYMRPEDIARQAWKILESFGHHSGHIFNLGHGILPDVSPEKLKFLVDFVREKSAFFHQRQTASQEEDNGKDRC
jgi:uroporphyrinogen decarboxylase